MSLRKYSLATIAIYAIAFFSPAFFQTEKSQIAATTVAYLLGALSLIVLYEKQNQKLSFEKRNPSRRQIFLLGLAGIFVAIFLQNIVIQIEQWLGQTAGSENTETIIQLIMKQPLFVIAAMIAGPIMEEFVFRRAIVGFFDSFNKAWLGVLISSLLFALIHQDGHLLLYFSLGCFFCFLYMYTGSIWTSITTHAGMNTLVILVQILARTQGLI